MPKHRQVRIRAGQGRRFTVDEGLAEFLPMLWHLGIETQMSCQENFPNVTWIVFKSQYDADRFTNHVNLLGLDFSFQFSFVNKLDSETSWAWGFFPEYYDDGYVYPSTVCVRFHKKFIDIITDRTRTLLLQNARRTFKDI